MAHHRAERLFGDDFGQDDVIGRIGEGRARGGQPRGIRRIGIAGASQILLLALGIAVDVDRLEVHVVGAEVIGKVQRRGGAGLNTDRSAVQLLGRADAKRARHHEALTVIVVHTGEFDLQLGIAREGPGGIARQQIDLAPRQVGEAILSAHGAELHLAGVAQDCRRDGLAERDIEAGPVAVRIGRGEADQPGIDATDHLVPALHRGKCITIGGPALCDKT